MSLFRIILTGHLSCKGGLPGSCLRCSCSTSSSYSRSVSSRLGGSVTLTCFSNEDSLALWIWHKQTPGQPMKPVVSAFSNRATFEDGVDKDHYEVESSKKSFNLTIKDIVAADEGLYYCGMSSLTRISYGDGVFLFIIVKQHYLLDPASEGDDVTLNCTVISGGCAGEHSVYWFRHGTPGSHPGIIYTHGDRSAGCEKNPEAGSSTQSCVYHLPKRNLSTTDAGTYYCAVAACGQIMIGIGTKLDVVDLPINISNTCLLQHDDALNYAALSFSSNKRRKMKKREETSVVYSGLVS
uniref:Ig-like domain-containing protein n=1 Tax=Denticeps clupeoides TaxID=299321 RepID=A0AAY4DEX5_9TELE